MPEQSAVITPEVSGTGADTCAIGAINRTAVSGAGTSAGPGPRQGTADRGDIETGTLVSPTTGDDSCSTGFGDPARCG